MRTPTLGIFGFGELIGGCDQTQSMFPFQRALLGTQHQTTPQSGHDGLGRQRNCDWEAGEGLGTDVSILMDLDAATFPLLVPCAGSTVKDIGNCWSEVRFLEDSWRIDDGHERWLTRILRLSRTDRVIAPFVWSNRSILERLRWGGFPVAHCRLSVCTTLGNISNP
ncbi:hypothetical protein P152DRAFT_256037 [Eremomyces bilateralis CBS 781.70]|uniref:Uncharacterized protein n=1 Tax=Eremomyces bilateralis CBS 781.70 TaxID=1392243 RepID=A0A6G1FQQ5_9PEZI|nr:uncharacterized protein P152DRAFT_256037 [Eremomyces bilateralis CBS 781.70]KAF1808127.1 hypothetical protein P152DRAFT_256037 [Eremomyces bilateralis CBS 781.70]